MNVQQILERCETHSEEALRVDDHLSTPLHICMWNDPPLSVVQALVQCNPHAAARQDAYGNTPLHIALYQRGNDIDVEIVKCFLNTAPHIAELADKEGMLPLHAACRHCPKNKYVINMLIHTFPRALRTHIKVS